MKLNRITSYVKENGIRQGAVLTLDRLLGRQRTEISYEQWLSCSRLSSHDYQKMEKTPLEHAPLIAVTASMEEEDRTTFFQSLNLQIYRGFRALKNCPQADYILAVEGSCTLKPELLWECASFLSDRDYSDVDLIYFDSDMIGEDGKKCLPSFRPDFDPDLLDRVNYMGNVVLVRTDLAYKAVLPSSGGAVFHRFLKRVCLEERDGTGSASRHAIVHIPKVLYHQNLDERLSLGEGAVLCSRFRGKWDPEAVSGREKPRQAHQAETEPCREADPPAHFPGDEPLISVLIPNKDHGEDLARCVDALLTVNTWQNLEILILENNSVEAETFRLYEELEAQDERIRVLRWDKAFNYSAINNFGAASARGEYLLLLNNDTQILEADSIARMQRLASSPETGAVGALLLYPDGRVQHGGIILGYGGIAGHAWEGVFPADIPAPFPRLVFTHTHNASAVTGACMMLRRSVFMAVGGMDEQLEVTFNDVDLCMRLRKEGLKVLMCPDACLIHDESASRGSEDTPQKVARFHQEIRVFVHRWETELEEGDPFYNPNLTLTMKSWTCRDERREARRPYLKYLNI